MKLVLVAVLLAGYIFLILYTFENSPPHRIFPYVVALVGALFGIFCSFYKLMCIHTNPSDELRRQNRDMITAVVTFIFYVFQNFMFLPLLFFEYVGHVCCTFLFLFTFQFAAFLVNAPLAVYHLVGTPPNPRKMRELRAVEPLVKFKLGFYFFSLAYYSYIIWSRPPPSMATSQEGE